TMLMLSTPPAITTSAKPHMIFSAAMAIVCRPEEQNRLTVIPGTSVGRPARTAMIRAMFSPCSPSGMAHPMITSSTSLGSTWGTRRISSLTTAAPSSSGRVFFSVPLWAFPTAVRTPATITASRITLLSSLFVSLFPPDSVPERLVFGQHVHHALLGLRLAGQAEEGFPFQIQQVLLVNQRPFGHRAPRQDVGQLAGDLVVVLRDVARLQQVVGAQFQHVVARLTHHRNLPGLRRPVSGPVHRQYRLFGVVQEMIPVDGDAVTGPQELVIPGLVRAGGHLGHADDLEHFVHQGLEQQLFLRIHSFGPAE